MYPGLEDLLVQFDPRDLQRLIDPKLERALQALVRDDAGGERRWLAQCVLASHGVSLFRRQDARKGLFRLMAAAQLQEIASDLCKRSYPKEEDNATALARLQWRPGADVVTFAAKHFDIPYAFLPHRDAHPPAVETVEVISRLPTLHGYQEEVKSRVVPLLKQPAASFLVQMPTGSGKTRTLVESIVSAWSESLASGSVVWLAHAEELCEQAAEAFGRVWAERAKKPTRLVRFFGPHDPPPYAAHGSIVIASLQKVYARLRAKSAFTDSLIGSAKVVVVDEAHRSLAPSFHQVIEQLTSGGAALAGLSATPGRGVDQESENRRLAEVFGGRLITPAGAGDMIARLQRRGVLAELRRKEIETGLEVTPNEHDLESVRLGFDYGTSVLRVLAADHYRNELILQAVEDEVSEQRPTIIFACTVEHARLLAAALNLRGVKAAYVDGEMDRTDRQYAISRFRDGSVDVITNFGVLTTGFDAPRTRTVVVARPTSSAILYGQMVGRALRGPRMGGGAEAWVIDVRDNLKRFGGVTTVYHAFERFWGHTSRE